MSSGVVIVLPKVSSFDSAQLLSFPRRQSLSPSYRAGMWRTLFKSVSRSCSSSSSSFSSPISNLIEFSFCSRTGWILDSRLFCANPRCMCFKHNYTRHSQECISLGERVPGILSSCSFKSYASIASAVEAISSTDADEETSSVEQIHQHFQVRSDRGNPISTSANILTKMAHRQQHPQKNSLVIGPGKFLMLRKRQIKIETEAWSQATQEYKELLMEMCERKLAPNLPYMKSLFLGWFEPFRDRIATEQKLAKRSKSKMSFASYFNALPADMMAVISMHKLTSMLMTGTGDGSVRVLHAALQIGDAIEQEARIRNFLLNTKKQKCQKDQAEDPVAKEEDRLRKKVLFLMKRQKLPQVRSIVKEKDGTRPWGQEIQAKVGSYLIELLIDTAYIQPPIDQHIDGPPDLRPAFRHSHKSGTLNSKRPMKYGVIQCDPLLQKGLERTGRHMVIPYMPMLIPPVKWTGYDKGGHLFLPSYIMRIHGARKQRHALKSAPRNQLQPIFEALDILGSTKWRINKRVLGIIDRIWSSGGRLADLVDREDVPLPDRPDTEDENAIKAWRWELRNAKKENMERHAHRCSIEIKLAVARKMQDEEGFYYPHNLDFRGRAYPMHANLNHLGSDLCRGVLEFAEGRPLGASGLRWLKIHLANLYGNGVDKKSYSGRLAFTESHLDDIFDSADSPLEGRRWWLTAEDPFQCLAVCINMAEALRSSSPETTISHAPVHQDGSCNGLQHYAALGRDQLGAAAVNLIGGEKPADVYSSIAARVLEIMQIDAEKDSVTYPNAVFAKLLISQVDRKLVKQTVMTSVYGVTFIGARDQIMKRLKERDAIADQKLLFHASNYAAKTVLTALGEMFQAARSIMTWLGDCAKLIAMENQLVRWITPLGLPVVQPYNKIGLKTVKTSLQVLTLHQETDMVMVKRQRTAFPPNFIHSLDGSHMMMTALACRNAGLNFAGVHDSYWTHACDVDELNKLIREKFVELYEQPILENLLESFQKLFPNLSFPELPERGDFDLNNVLDSPYFFN